MALDIQMALDVQNVGGEGQMGSSSHQVNGTKFSISSLISMLNSTSQDSLRTALTELNSSFQPGAFGERPDASDKRIQLAIDFIANGGIGELTTSPDDDNSKGKVEGIWSAWNVLDNLKSTTVLPLVLRLLANIIQLLDVHQPNHEHAEPIVQSLLPFSHSALGQSHWHRLQTYLSEIESQSMSRSKGAGKGRARDTSSDELISSSLQLLLSLTSFAGAKYARKVFDNMNWGMKSLSKLFNMRRKNIRAMKRDSKRKSIVNVQSTATLAKPDIRTLWIMVLLSFLRSTSGGCTSTSLRIAALSMGREIYPAMMKGLTDDPAQIVAYILMGLHDGLLSDEASIKMPRGKVVGLFNEWTCKSLVAMYDREGDTIRLVQSEEEHSIADIVHHFLLALCTHPGRGVCYADNGWYGRKDEKTLDEEGQEEGETVNSLNIYNKILLGVLRNLTPYRCPKQGELALRILAASPELSGPYFATLTTILDPKPASISWLSASTFFGRAINLPLPDFHTISGEWMPLPPPKKICMDAILPNCIAKGMFTRGITMQDRLSRFATISLIVRVLSRLISFRQICQAAGESCKDENAINVKEVESKSTESILRGEFGLQSSTSNPWMIRWDEIASEAHDRLPDITHLLSSSVTESQTNTEEAAQPDSSAMLEATLRACWMYLEVLPSFDTISNTDVEKLFQLSLDEKEQEESEGLRSLARVHAIRAVAARIMGNDRTDFDIFARTSTSLEGTASSASSLNKLLLLSNSSTLPVLSDTSKSLLAFAMRSSVLFEHDEEEWQGWQYALRGQEKELYDFIDECAQRCLKTPYRYIEMARKALIASTQPGEDDQMMEIVTSPLLYTLLEQFVIRSKKGLLPSESFSQSFSNFICQLAHALCISGRPTRLLINLLDELKEAVEGNLILRIDTMQKYLEVLTQPLNTSSTPVSSEVALSAYMVDGSIQWNKVIAIDAKIIFLSLLPNLIYHDGNTNLVDNIRQTLEWGAKDYNFLRLHLFGNTKLMQTISGKPNSLNGMIEIITNGPFDRENDEDKELLSEFIGVLWKGKGQSLFALSSLAEFMNIVDQQRLVESLIKDGGHINLLSGILTIDNTIQLFDDDIVKLVRQSGTTKVISDILQIVAYAQSREKDDDSGSILLHFILENISNIHAGIALRKLLSRYPSLIANIIKYVTAKGQNVHMAKVLIALTEAFAQPNSNIHADKVEEMETVFVSQVFSKDEIVSIAALRSLMVLSRSSDVYSNVLHNIPNKPVDVCKAHILQFALHAVEQNGQNENVNKLVKAIMEKTLLRLVRRFAEDDEESTETIKSVEAFVSLLKARSSLLSSLSHLVEPVLIAAIERRSDSEIHAELIGMLLTAVPLKSLTLQQFFDDLLHNRSAMAEISIRSEIVSSITICIERDTSIANSSLLGQLARLYGGTLDRSDRQILQTILMLEQNKEGQMLTLLKDWNGMGDQAGFNDDNLIWRLNPDRVLDLVQHFPRFRSYGDLKATGYGNIRKVEDSILSSVYDPLFILSIYGQFLSNDRNPSGLQLVQMMRTNALGAVICCLSSSDLSVRQMAAVLIAKTYKCVHLAQFQEKDQLLLVLDALRNSLHKADLIVVGQNEIQQIKSPLPLTITIFVAHAIRAIAQPSLYLYPLISRFLLQRAKPLDPTDVPLLFGFLYASSYQTQTHKQQKLFILRFLNATLRFGGESDWKIMRHRHVWQGVCMLYTSSKSTFDNGLQRAIEEFWSSAMEKEYVVLYAVLRTGFLEYVQQLLIMDKTVTKQSAMFWLDIMSKLALHCDLNKLHKGTEGTWIGSIRGFIELIKKADISTIPVNLQRKLVEMITKVAHYLVQHKEEIDSTPEKHYMKTIESLMDILSNASSTSEEGKEKVIKDLRKLIKENEVIFSKINPEIHDPIS